MRVRFGIFVKKKFALAHSLSLSLSFVFVDSQNFKRTRKLALIHAYTVLLTNC